MAVNLIGGENWRKPPTCCKLLTNFITYCCIEYTSPWTGVWTHNSSSGDRHWLHR